MRRNAVRKGSSGFTLIEMLVAVSLLLVGFMGITTLVLSSIHSNNYNRNLAMADNLSANLVEFWQSATYQKVEFFLDEGSGTSYVYATDTTPSFSDTQLNTAITTWRTQITENLPNGRGVVTVTENTDISGINAADIEVRVQWIQKGHVYNATKTLYRSDI